MRDSEILVPGVAVGCGEDGTIGDFGIDETAESDKLPSIFEFLLQTSS